MPAPASLGNRLRRFGNRIGACRDFFRFFQALTERHVGLDVGFVTLGDEAGLAEVAPAFGVLATKQVALALLTTEHSAGAGNLETF